MSRRNKKKPKKNHLRTFNTRAVCPECSSVKLTLLNKSRSIFQCLSCEHKFIWDEGVYDTLIPKVEQVEEIQEEKEIIIAEGKDPLSDFFSDLKI